MKTGNAIILMTVVVLVVFVGLVAAEDFMMPQEIEENQTVIANNSTDNANSTVDVKRHIPPRGVMQKMILFVWDPFGHAPVDSAGFKIFNNALWYRCPDGTWIQVALIGPNHQITNIFAWDQKIVQNIKNIYQTTNNVTINIIEEPSAYNPNQPETNSDTNINNSSNPEKINTTIKLDDQTLKNDTNTTITGTLVDQNGTAISNAEVTITVNGKKYTQTTDTNGKFSYEYNTESSDLSIGSNSMQVSYSGNDTYNGISKTITITLKAVEEAVNETVDNKETETSSGSSSSNTNEHIDNSPEYYQPEDINQPENNHQPKNNYQSENNYVIEEY